LLCAPPILISAPPPFAKLNYFVFLVFIYWLHLVFTIYTSSAFLLHLQLLLCTPHFSFISHPCFNFMLRVPLIFINLAPLPHLFHVYFMHSHIYFTHPAYLLRAPPKSDNSPPMYLFLIFGHVFMHYSLHLPHYSCTLLLFFFTFIFFVIIFFSSFLKKEKMKMF